MAKEFNVAESVDVGVEETADDGRWHRQLGICRLPEGAMGLSDARRYA